MSYAKRYFLFGLVLVFLGMSLGQFMGAKEDFSLTPLHVHNNLLGFVLSMLFGLLYLNLADLRSSSLAAAQFWLWVAGVLMMDFGLYMMFGAANEAMGIFAVIGGFVLMLSVLIMIAMVWRAGID